jgi:hypothetical protein
MRSRQQRIECTANSAVSLVTDKTSRQRGLGHERTTPVRVNVTTLSARARPSTAATTARPAWVYTRSGGVWTQQGNELVGTGAVGPAEQGYCVGLSADGNRFFKAF